MGCSAVHCALIESLSTTRLDDSPLHVASEEKGEEREGGREVERGSQALQMQL